MRELLYTALGLAAGIGIPLMATLNAGLSARMGSPVASAAILCLVAFLTLTAIFLLSGASTGTLRWPAPYIGYAAGLFAAFYMFSITFLAPRIGVGNAVFLVLFGQLVSAATIDHLGLFGAPQVSVSAKRLVGLVVMAIGIFLARKPL